MDAAGFICSLDWTKPFVLASMVHAKINVNYCYFVAVAYRVTACNRCVTASRNIRIPSKELRAERELLDDLCNITKFLSLSLDGNCLFMVMGDFLHRNLFYPAEQNTCYWTSGSPNFTLWVASTS
jgi:hypothetical protein